MDVKKYLSRTYMGSVRGLLDEEVPSSSPDAQCSELLSTSHSQFETDFSEMDMISRHGFDFPKNRGGNAYMSTAYLARWDGPVLEVGYENQSGERQRKEGNHVQEVLFLPRRKNPMDNSVIKNAIKSYGAVCAQIWAEYKNCYNAPKYSFWNYYHNKGDWETFSFWHIICIVGWDDNYDRANFRPKAPGNGAFICRNSANINIMENGYFYVSYYDNTIGDYCVVYNGIEPSDNYDYIYQYDYLGQVKSTGYNNETAYFANVFTADKCEREMLTAVSFYTNADNTVYEIFYNEDFVDISSFADLKKTGQGGIISTRGYHTIDLNKPVCLTRGKKFAVAVRVTTLDYKYPIPIQCPKVGYSSKVMAEVGQSFGSFDGIWWEDFNIDSFGKKNKNNINVCLKAFTRKTHSFIDIGHFKPESDLENYVITSYENEAEIEDIKFYDLRLQDRLTSIKNQGNSNYCWSYAACASLESCLISNAPKEKRIDVAIDKKDRENISIVHESECNDGEIHIFINGELHRTFTPPRVINGEVFLPYDEISFALGSVVKLIEIANSKKLLEDIAQKIPKKMKILDEIKLDKKSKLYSFSDFSVEEKIKALDDLKGLGKWRLSVLKEIDKLDEVQELLKSKLLKLIEKNDGSNKSVVVWTKDNLTEYIVVAMQIDGKYAKVNKSPSNQKHDEDYDEYHMLENMVQIINYNITVPVGFLVEKLGGRYNWDPVSNTVSIVIRSDIEVPEQSYLYTREYFVSI